VIALGVANSKYKTMTMKELTIDRMHLNEKHFLIGLVIFSLLLSIGSYITILVIPVSFALLSYFLVYIASGKKTLMILGYIYIVVWENYTSIFGMSCVSLISLIMAIYFLIYLFHTHLKVDAIDIVLLIFVAFYGIICLITTSNPSGIVIISDTVIAIVAHSVIKQDLQFDRRFWPLFFRFLYISVVMSVLVGYVDMITGNAQTVYISGHIQRLGGTVGTDRIGMLLCAALVYPLYFEKDRIKRLIETLFMICAALTTVGGTTVVCLAVCALIYVYFRMRNKSVKRNVKMRFFVIAILTILAFIFLWNNQAGIPAIDLMMLRIKKIYTRFVESGVSVGLSGRGEIWGSYLNYWNGLNPLQQLFGTASLSHSDVFLTFNHAHNTYIDMILYVGIIFFLMWISYIIYNVRKYRRTFFRDQICILKIAYLIVGMSVSMLTGCYWWIIVLL